MGTQMFKQRIAMSRCPVCEGIDGEKIADIAQTALISYYSKTLKVDTSALLSKNERISLIKCVGCDVRWYEPAPSGDANFYEQLQQHDWYYQDEKPEYSFAASFISDGAMVLEVGCGKGAFRKFLPSNVGYHGLEFNKEAVTKGRNAGLSIEIESIETHAETNRFKYDIVCSFQVLEHVQNPKAFLSACAQCLKPGGLLIIAVPSEDSFLSIAEEAYLNMPPHHLTRWTDNALQRVFAAIGMSVVNLWHEPVANYHQAWYETTIARYGFRKILGQHPQMITSDLVGRIANRLIAVSPIREKLVRYGERCFIHGRRGHTVCIVGENRNYPNES